jgi:hypothetical protein
MPGRLDRNLRRGHRAETLGIELLRAFCAVAQIPQSEDYGIDAVATVLRAEERFWMAGQSFWVQFKARSVRTLEYDREKYAWLRRLALPLFVAFVDLGSCEIALYTTHNVACRIDADLFDAVVMHLGPEPPVDLTGAARHSTPGSASRPPDSPLDGRGL